VLDIEVLSQAELGIGDVEETGSSFVANALIKARHAAAMSGLPAVADDSGLVVDALGGRPGVWSARYAGPLATDSANVDKLLGEMAEIADADRGASFHCTACLVRPDGSAPLIAEGDWRGVIARERRGSGGFGYDPVFVDLELGRSAAELSSTEKDQRSHRGKAFRALLRLMQESH